MDNETPTSRLGRGLSSMVGEVAGIKAGAVSTGGGFTRLRITEIRQPHPGRTADDALTASVKKYGVLQPVLVARQGESYELLAGARRIDAATAAGLADVPALIIPPDRAGALDVFLEENLTRSELSESERMRLRDRWMRETGRDLAQAEERIPELPWESAPVKPVKNPRIWSAAAAVLAVVATILLILLLNAKPVDRRPVVIPVDFVEAPAPVEEPPVDVSWMEAFRFPGYSRSVEGDNLNLTLTEPLMEGLQLSARGKLFLNQLAAIITSNAKPLSLEITATIQAAAAAYEHLVNEGVDFHRILIQPGVDGATSFRVSPGARANAQDLTPAK